MQGGSCTYELVNNMWIVQDKCLGEKTCEILTATVGTTANIPANLTNPQSPRFPITFTATGVRVHKNLIGHSVQVSSGLSRASVENDTVLEYTRPAAAPQQRLAARIGCDGAADFQGVETFDASTLPQPVLSH